MIIGRSTNNTNCTIFTLATSLPPQSRYFCRACTHLHNPVLKYFTTRKLLRRLFRFSSLGRLTLLFSLKLGNIGRKHDVLDRRKLVRPLETIHKKGIDRVPNLQHLCLRPSRILTSDLKERSPFKIAKCQVELFD